MITYLFWEKANLYSHLASFLRSSGWSRWEVALLRCSPLFVYWVFRPGERFPSIVAKLATTGDSKEGLRSEANALEKLKDAPEELGIPRLLDHGDGPAGYLLLQSGKRGLPLVDNVFKDDPAGLVEQLWIAGRWLEGFQAAVGSAGPLSRSLQVRISRWRSILVNPTAAEEALMNEAQDALDRHGSALCGPGPRRFLAR